MAWRCVLALVLGLVLVACSGESGDADAESSSRAPSSATATQGAGSNAQNRSIDPKRNRPGEPGFDPTKAVWPPLNPPVPDEPKDLILRVDKATQHGLHTTINMSFHGARDEIGDFSFTILFKDANNRGLSYQRVMVPLGADTREFTLMGVQADKITGIDVELQDAQTLDGYYLGELSKRYETVVEDKR